MCLAIAAGDLEWRWRRGQPRREVMLVVNVIWLVFVVQSGAINGNEARSGGFKRKRD